MTTAADFKVIQPAGILSSRTSEKILQEFQDSLDARAKAVLIDLSQVNFMDSSGLGLLVSMHTRLRLAGGKLYLCSLSEQCKGILDISDLDRVFEIFNSPSEFYAVVLGGV